MVCFLISIHQENRMNYKIAVKFDSTIANRDWIYSSQKHLDEIHSALPKNIQEIGRVVDAEWIDGIFEVTR